MAWDEPAPARYSRAPSAAPAVPGHGPGERRGFGAMLGLALVAACVGACAYVAVHAGVEAWHEAHDAARRTLGDRLIALGVAAVLALWMFRYLLLRPRTVGLPAHVRDRGGRFGPLAWNDGDSVGSPALGEAGMAEALTEVVCAVLDSAD